MAQFSFNADDAPPAADFEPMPDGWYTLVVDKTDIKPTASGDGKRLAVEISVVGGAYNGRKVFEGFNIQNPNPEAVKISMAQLGSLTRACGKVAFGDSNELCGIPFLGKLKIKPAQGQYEASNKVVAYKPANADVTDKTEKKTATVSNAAPWGR